MCIMNNNLFSAYFMTDIRLNDSSKPIWFWFPVAYFEEVVNTGSLGRFAQTVGKLKLADYLSGYLAIWKELAMWAPNKLHWLNFYVPFSIRYLWTSTWGYGGAANFLGSGGSLPLPPTRGNPVIIYLFNRL